MSTIKNFTENNLNNFLKDNMVQNYIKIYSKKIQRGRVSAKTIRKWHLSIMIKEGITESVADFILV